jgi:RNA polymerase sigma-70 factor (ECF subfamily)
MADGDTVRELYEGCYRRLVGQLFAICGNLGEAEDAVQEAFVRAVEKPGGSPSSTTRRRGCAQSR